MADVLTGDQSYYADGVQKDSQALASDLRKFISSMKDLQNRVDDPSNTLGTAVNHLARYADAFQEVIDRSEPVDHIQIPPESSPATNDKNEMYVPDLGPYSPPNPLSPDQWKKEQEASLWTSENTESRPVGMISDNYPRLQRRGVSSTFAGNNPAYLAQPASSPQIDGTPANSPVPRLPK